MAVRTTVMDNLSGSMKSSAFAMEMKTSEGPLSSVVELGERPRRRAGKTLHGSFSAVSKSSFASKKPFSRPDLQNPLLCTALKSLLFFLVNWAKKKCHLALLLKTDYLGVLYTESWQSLHGSFSSVSKILNFGNK